MYNYLIHVTHHGKFLFEITRFYGSTDIACAKIIANELAQLYSVDKGFAIKLSKESAPVRQDISAELAVFP